MYKKEEGERERKRKLANNLVKINELILSLGSAGNQLVDRECHWMTRSNQSKDVIGGKLSNE